MGTDGQARVGRAAAMVLKAHGTEIRPGYRHAQIGRLEILLTRWQPEQFVASESERMALLNGKTGEWPWDQTYQLEIYHRTAGGQRHRVFAVLWSPNQQMVEEFRRGSWEADLLTLAKSGM